MTQRERLKALMGECWEDATETAPRVAARQGVFVEHTACAILAAALFRARWTLEMKDESVTWDDVAWEGDGKIAETIGRGEEEETPGPFTVYCADNDGRLSAVCHGRTLAEARRKAEEVSAMNGWEVVAWHGPDWEMVQLSVDHDHATGKVRGLLCLSCNQMLGKIERWWMHILEYYRRAG